MSIWVLRSHENADVQISNFCPRIFFSQKNLRVEIQSLIMTVGKSVASRSILLLHWSHDRH